MDSDTNIEQLKSQVKEFCQLREWDPYHGAKDLAIGAVTEASELLEHFRFQSHEQVEEIMSNPETRLQVGEEMADVLFFLLRMSERYGLDLSQCFAEKMQKNGLKYPAEEFRGKNHKSRL